MELQDKQFPIKQKKRSIRKLTVEGNDYVRVDDTISYVENSNLPNRGAVICLLQDYLGGKHPSQKPESDQEQRAKLVKKPKVDSWFSGKDLLTWEQATDLLQTQVGVATLTEASDILRNTPRHPDYDRNGRKIYVYEPAEIGLAYAKHVRK